MRKFLVTAIRIDNDLMGLVYAKLVHAEDINDAENAFLLECREFVDGVRAIDVTDFQPVAIRRIRLAFRNELKAEYAG